MLTKTQKSVSRETSGVSDILELFRNDHDFMLAISLLEHRNSLVLNTGNSTFVLIWLKMLRDRGYFPLVVFDKERDAEAFYADALGFFSPNSLSWIPLFSGGSSMRENPALENHISRFLDNHYNNTLDIILSSDQIFKQKVPDKVGLRENILRFSVGNEMSYSSLSERLVKMGYQRSGATEYCGEFAIRGGIIDIYAYGETYPFRIEFFGDSIESVRRFNPGDQNTFDSCKDVYVRPASFSVFSHSTILDILPKNTVVVKILDQDTDEQMSFYDSAIPFKQVSFKTAEPGADVHFSMSDIEPPTKADSSKFYEHILNEHRHVLVFTEHDLLKESFREKLGEKASYYHINVSVGFQYKPLDLVLLSGREIFHKEHYVNPNKRFIPERSSRVETLDSLEYGEAVVHVDYGIGLYRGIELLEFRGIKQEAMVVEYKNKDRVFVPIRYMNKIFKYSSEKPTEIHLDQIGSSRWEHAKASTRNYLKKAAFDLLALYRDRKKLSGFAFHPDTPDTLQLEASFPYEETPDQLRAIQDIKNDMERDRIMDRLVCGDVGFGKTEVAIRAAFKSVYSGKQVAVLVPTTMLCFQHYESFYERLEAFGVKVSYINRFVSPKVLKERLEGVKNGQIDILVGTHKILSNNLLFKDLGLLIIDEEHRFGVNHKEKIQNMKRLVDVLTLTATPIPRTLQLSLVGLRDITKINTPPKERLPISTKIMYWSDVDIKAAIQRELERNGQVFILHNIIEEQPALQEKIEEMFPSFGVRTAHGKMTGKELENTMLDFHHHRFDILISTTIIESGIDVPNANTLIVMNAHNFGLSQLYQIRGRVGRSYRKAFAYLVVPRGKHINPTAMKRLQTLEYYTDLGSGYQIAMRDLEIRGAGSLFGVEQSGHINRLGYAYFNRLFTEEVETLKLKNLNIETSMNNVVDIHLEQAAYFPDNYIDNKDVRISCYRKISEILSSNKEDQHVLQVLEHLNWSIRDRFGQLPPEAKNLFAEARLALWLRNFHIESMVKKDDSLVVVFQKNAPLSQLQISAGKFLHILNEHNIDIEFISKKHLSAKVGIGFLSAFFEGTNKLQ
ncbi:MAG: transcription-repair coupling factor [Candidatus Neomarinimicrobiota bacterium]|nr:MAG: transcription-repair coupling factor [Candidatus Neomarinimicrobiota bacterium]